MKFQDTLKMAGLGITIGSVLAGCSSRVGASAEAPIQRGEDAFHMWNTVKNQQPIVDQAIKSGAKEVRVQLPASEDIRTEWGNDLHFAVYTPNEASAKISQNTTRLSIEVISAASEIKVVFPTLNRIGQLEAKATIAGWSSVSPDVAKIADKLEITAPVEKEK